MVLNLGREAQRPKGQEDKTPNAFYLILWSSGSKSIDRKEAQSSTNEDSFQLELKLAQSSFFQKTNRFSVCFLETFFIDQLVRSVFPFLASFGKKLKEKKISASGQSFGFPKNFQKWLLLTFQFAVLNFYGLFYFSAE